MPNPLRISIFFHERASVSFALLCASVFRIANRLKSDPAFAIRLVGTMPLFFWDDGEIRLRDVAEDTDWLIIPPIETFVENKEASEEELAALRTLSSRHAVIASACLGAFLPAAAGLLKGREATTHWSRIDYAMQKYPDIRWNGREMLIDHGDIVTAGGLLSVVDLCLHIVRRTCGKDFAHRLGQHLLADTIRQKQSIYATTLTAPPKNGDKFAALEQEVERRGANSPSAAEMAHFCGMSLRSFHRHFEDNYGLSPIKYLQLRKVEIAKNLLSEYTLPLEAVAERAGFSDMAFFRSVFARETGMTPGQFRKMVNAA